MTHIDDGKHVLEGGVGEQEEHCTVDVHYAGLINLLTEIDHAQDKSNYLKN